MVLMRKRAIDRFLLQVVDGSVAGVILFVPLLMGGRHAVGQLALTVLAVAAAWAWSVRQCLCNDATWRPTAAMPLILAGLVLLVLQVVPLPPSLLAWLAPDAAELLPLWKAGGGGPAALGSWSYVSFTPAETRAGLVLFLDFVLLFFVVVQRVGHIEDVERLLRWCALSAVGMATFGIVQLFTGNGKFYWFYQHPFAVASEVAKGSFTNRNHFAHFLALGVGPLLWWLQDSWRRARARTDAAARSPHVHFHREELKTYLLGLALGVVLFAGLLSLSRGGISVLFLATGICAAVCYWASSVSGRFVAALGVVGLLIGVSLAIFGSDRVSHRLEDLYAGSIERLDGSGGRRTIWAAAAEAISHHPRLGTGVGSFSAVYPMYTGALLDDGLEYTHAENSPLQVAVETGVLGLGLILGGILLSASWCIRGVRPSTARRLRVCAAATTGSLAAAVAHAMVDFVWYVPACMAIVAILAACAMRIPRLAGNEERRTRNEELPKSSLRVPVSRSSLLVPRFFWTAAALGLTLIGGWMVCNRVGPALAQPYWDEYLVARDAAQVLSSVTPDTALADAERQKQWIACLENVVWWEPTHARAHLALAEAHRRLFDALQTKTDNPMSLSNIRDAAIQSRFPTREAMAAWLERAAGKHWVHLEWALYHTWYALGLSPLEGSGYVSLADLLFLRGGDAALNQACIQQALRVRPHQGAVLYAAGGEALLAGDVDRWLAYCKQAFRCGRRQQRQLMGDLAATTPAENLPGLCDFIIREFQPDLWDLRFLYDACAKRCRPEQLAGLVRRRAEQAQIEAAGMGPIEAASVWLEAEQLYSQLHEAVEALKCVRKAVQCGPDNYDVHYRLALCLLNQQSFGEAESHLRWCQQRTPGNQNVETKLREALKGRLDSQHGTAAESPRVIVR